MNMQIGRCHLICFFLPSLCYLFDKYYQNKQNIFGGCHWLINRSNCKTLWLVNFIIFFFVFACELVCLCKVILLFFWTLNFEEVSDHFLTLATKYSHICADDESHCRSPSQRRARFARRRIPRRRGPWWHHQIMGARMNSIAWFRSE